MVYTETLTDNELKLLDMIRTDPNPKEAFRTALDLLLEIIEKNAKKKGE